MSPFTGKKGVAPRKEVAALRDGDEDDRDNAEVPLAGEHARDRADDRLIEDLEKEEEDHEPLNASDDDLKLGQVALEKVCISSLSLPGLETRLRADIFSISSRAFPRRCGSARPSALSSRASPTMLA